MVIINVPAFQIPYPSVVPSEKITSPLSPTSSRRIGLDTIAAHSPDIVTTELLDARKSASLMSVTVILFVVPGIGVLCPIAFVVNLAPSTCDDCIIAMSTIDQISLPDCLGATERERNGKKICVPFFIVEANFENCRHEMIQP